MHGNMLWYCNNDDTGNKTILNLSYSLTETVRRQKVHELASLRELKSVCIFAVTPIMESLQ